jgi:hypothetical protein
METITICTTGIESAGGKPAAIGVYVHNAKGDMVSEGAETIGNASDHYASYQAVMRGLQTVVEIYGAKTSEMKFVLQLNNDFVSKQLNSKTEIKEPGLVPYFIEIHNMRVVSFPQLTITCIERTSNVEAYRLVVEALAA